ncbi:MAG: phytanoyl-CoA dioxygenase family protein [Candidatus Latescibacteria bacterium]|nr:phytanoyl-CoA dioxygenase family protein [Candidatus Latescibacterota bacterium]
MNDNLKTAIDHLSTYGYCLLEDRIPAEMARSMAERFLELHADPKNKSYISGDEHYQTFFGMMNFDDRVWACASHPDTVAIARHFLGPTCRVVEACSKPTWPGAPPQGLHADSAGNFAQVPDVPWMVNTIWMLTDFTVENGATGVVPMSHRSRMKGPPPDLTLDSPLIKPITGRAGSVMLWHGGLFHMARGNTSGQIRVGLNIAYYPRWFNNWVEGGHQPVWPETYVRMPDEMKRLCPGLRGRNRAEMYEQ